MTCSDASHETAMRIAMWQNHEAMLRLLEGFGAFVMTQSPHLRGFGRTDILTDPTAVEDREESGHEKKICSLNTPFHGSTRN